MDLAVAIARCWNNKFLWVILFTFVGGILASCPDSRLIQPCLCQSENNVVSMVCANLQSVQQLMKIFEPPFPVNQLWHLTVKHSKLDDLEANLLGDKSFAVILFQNVTGVSKILPHAFAASVERLRVLTFDSSPLLNILSVQGIDDLENLVDFEVTASVDELIVHIASLISKEIANHSFYSTCRIFPHCPTCNIFTYMEIDLQVRLVYHSYRNCIHSG